MKAKRGFTWTALSLLLVGLQGCVGGRGGERSDPGEMPLARLADHPEEYLKRAKGAYVVVDLDVNRLRFMDGGNVVWEAPVGTGTGLRLESDDAAWEFDTPRGVFQIQYKEEVPVWYLPDWYFVEKNLPVPPRGSPQREVRGQLGVAAVYLGQDLAIHGTSHPELLGQRVSHGCIRVENKYAMRLFHNVQIGTPVVIVGGEDLEPISAEDVPTPKAPPQIARDTMGARGTDELLRRLERQLRAAGPEALWVPEASRLITRGLKDDAPALRGVLALAGRAGDETTNREYATFLADAFARGPLRVVVSLARIEARERERAAAAIVDATMRLQPVGTMESAKTPWPTTRVPSWRLGPDGQAGWQALREAEEEYRARYAGGAGTTNERRGS